MNSSGMKRGLAASAISALAVAGLPFLASSADAATGDSIAVTYTGPALNGGTEGAVVVLETKGVDDALLKLASTTSSAADSQNNADQSATILDHSKVADPDHAGYDIITLHIQTTTSTTGAAAAFRVFEDDAPTNDALDAAEARANVSVSTAGPVSKIAVAPASQSVAQGQTTGDYTVTLQDSAGRTTQLLKGDSVNVTSDGDITINADGPSITSDEIDRGTDTFTATAKPAAALGSHDINLADVANPTATGKATVVVTKAAVVTADEVDIVTGADTWDGFGGGTIPGTTQVRVDQSSIRIDFKGDDKNSTVTLNLTGNGITFGGKSTATVSTVLDENGVGSITITPDAGTVQVGDTINIGGSMTQTLDFERAHADTVKPTADPYFSKVGGSVDVTATVLDQFGQPLTSGYVEASRSGVNNDTTPQRKAVGSDGSVTFTFTDAKATNGDTDTVTFEYFPDQYATASTASGDTHIKYTTDGMGANYTTSLDGNNTESPTYKPSDTSVIPLGDAVANDQFGTFYPDGNESADLAITGGEKGADVTVSVDNGALILANGENKLSQGSSSITDVLDPVTGNLPAGYRIIGTKSGVVTVTIVSAHRTETAQMTITDNSLTEEARNVAVSGPATVPAGTTQIAYTAVVTDAFGNPIANVSVGQLNIQVTGPAEFQDSDAMTNAAGQINLNVRVDSGAVGDVTIRVQGLNSEFGAAADHLFKTSQSKDAEGLSASSDVATATTTVEAAPVPPRAPRLNGRDNGANDDRLKVNAAVSDAGKTAKLYKIKDGARKVIAKAVLDSNGDYRFTVADKNGNHRTKYVAKVGKVWTNKKSVR